MPLSLCFRDSHLITPPASAVKNMFDGPFLERCTREGERLMETQTNLPHGMSAAQICDLVRGAADRQEPMVRCAARTLSVCMCIVCQYCVCHHVFLCL